jgi:hypothetical protein
VCHRCDGFSFRSPDLNRQIAEKLGVTEGTSFGNFPHGRLEKQTSSVYEYTPRLASYGDLRVPFNLGIDS